MQSVLRKLPAFGRQNAKGERLSNASPLPGCNLAGFIGILAFS
jgi:hypothetical protein